jgi:anion-transporting  ArsA/GET3 family ATPase
MNDRAIAPRLPGSAPLPQPLLFVMGKGGVGRSTTAAALAVLCARRGARTIVAELSGRGELARMFDRPPSAAASAAAGNEVEIAERLYAIQIEPQRALDEYLREQLPLRVLADLFGATRTLGFLAAATPGLPGLLSVGKIWELAQPVRKVPGAEPYDRVIVDAPASGHSLALLAAPQAFARAAQAGPIARQGREISAMLLDPARTAMLAVATPHDAAVSELLEMRSALAGELGRELDAVLVNAMPANRFASGDAVALRGALAREGALGEDARAAVERALDEAGEAHDARTQVERLRNELPGTPLVELAFSHSAEFAVAELEALADQLAEVL